MDSIQSLVTTCNVYYLEVSSMKTLLKQQTYFHWSTFLLLAYNDGCDKFLFLPSINCKFNYVVTWHLQRSLRFKSFSHSIQSVKLERLLSWIHRYEVSVNIRSPFNMFKNYAVDFSGYSTKTSICSRNFQFSMYYQHF